MCCPPSWMSIASGSPVRLGLRALAPCLLARLAYVVRVYGCVNVWVTSTEEWDTPLVRQWGGVLARALQLPSSAADSDHSTQQRLGGATP